MKAIVDPKSKTPVKPIPKATNFDNNPAALKSQRDDYANQLQLASTEKEELKREKTVLKEQLEKTQAEKNYMNSMMAAMMNEKDGLTEALNTANEQLKAAKIENGNLEKIILALQFDKANIQTKCEDILKSAEADVEKEKKRIQSVISTELIPKYKRLNQFSSNYHLKTIINVDNLDQDPLSQKEASDNLLGEIEELLAQTTKKCKLLEESTQEEQKKLMQLHEFIKSMHGQEPQTQKNEQISSGLRIQETFGLLSSIKKSLNHNENIQKCDIKNPLILYDTIIKTKTFSTLIEEPGWKIVARKIVDPAKSTVVSILGNYNKGKSWILSFLSCRTLPVGYNIHTKGVSCIYPQDTNNPITYLDSAGFDEPLKITKHKRKLQLKKDKADGSEEQKQNEADNNDTTKISDLLKDKQYVEHFIQRFLLDTADVILVTVGQLTFTDQKLVRRIQEDYKGQKTIFIIHNLFTLNTVDDVKKFIVKDIEKSFDVEPIVFPVTDSQQRNHIYYREKAANDICHVVMSREGMESGRYYNESAREIITSSIKHKINSQRSFNIEEDLQKYLKERFSNYVENSSEYETELSVKENVIIPDEKFEEKQSLYSSSAINLGANDHLIIEKNDRLSPFTMSGQLKLHSSKNIDSFQFKKSVVDEFGFLTLYLSSNKKLELPYHIYENDKEFCFEIETAGIAEPENLEILPEEDNDGFYFRVSGRKEPKKEITTSIVQKTQYGDISFFTQKVTPVSKLNEIELYDNYKKEARDGVLVFRWPRKNKVKRKL